MLMGRPKRSVCAGVFADARGLVNRCRRRRLGCVQSHGFTLIELLVVIGIIALLMAVLLPSLSLARKRARAIVCRSHLKGWGTTLGLYLEENEGRFWFTGLDEQNEGTDSALSLLRGLRIGGQNDPNKTVRYHGVQTDGIACCPMATKSAGSGGTDSDTLAMTFGGVFASWEITNPAPAFRMSYGLNKFVLVRQFFGLLPGPAQARRTYLDVFALKSRTNIPLLLDATLPSVCLIAPELPPPQKEPAEFTDGVWINRHQGGINFLFLDLSVSDVGLKGLWTLRWNLGFDTHGPWTKAGGVQPEDWPQWMRGFKDY
jgi:prepilin-type N-terminal cleavage/methylation domain-containing protein/prepilin-type processing-associated H-X9-DG protein